MCLLFELLDSEDLFQHVAILMARNLREELRSAGEMSAPIVSDDFNTKTDNK